MEGTFNLLPDGRYRFGGHAAIRDPGNRALLQAMSLLGSPGGDGRWALSLSGVLNLCGAKFGAKVFHSQHDFR